MNLSHVTAGKTRKQAGTHLFDARFVWIVERACFDVFWYQLTADFWNLFPVLKHGQRQLFVRTSLPKP